MTPQTTKTVETDQRVICSEILNSFPEVHCCILEGKSMTNEKCIACLVSFKQCNWCKQVQLCYALMTSNAAPADTRDLVSELFLFSSYVWMLFFRKYKCVVTLKDVFYCNYIYFGTLCTFLHYRRTNVYSDTAFGICDCNSRHLRLQTIQEMHKEQVSCIFYEKGLLLMHKPEGLFLI